MVTLKSKQEFIGRLTQACAIQDEDTIRFLTNMKNACVNIETDSPSNVIDNSSHMAMVLSSMAKVIAFYWNNEFDGFDEKARKLWSDMPDQLILTSGELFDLLKCRTKIFQKDVLIATKCNLGAVDLLLAAIDNNDKAEFTRVVAEHNVDFRNISKRIALFNTPEFEVSMDINELDMNLEEVLDKMPCYYTYAKLDYRKWEETHQQLPSRNQRAWKNYLEQPDPILSWIIGKMVTHAVRENGEVSELLLEVASIMYEKIDGCSDKEAYDGLLASFCLHMKILIFILSKRNTIENNIVRPLLETYYFAPIFDRLMAEWKNVSQQEAALIDKLESSCQETSASLSPVIDDTYVYRLTQEPSYKHSQIKLLANRLAGVPNENNDSNFVVEKIYLIKKDIPAFYYFLTGEPIDGFTLDTQSIINWQGTWKSLKYLLCGLYGEKSLPDGVYNTVSSCFTFQNGKVKEITLSKTSLTSIKSDFLRKYRDGKTEKDETDILNRILSFTKKPKE